MFLLYSVDDDVPRKQERYAGNSQSEDGGYSAKPCPTALSKEARRAVVDKLRSKRIAAMTQHSSDDETVGASKDEYSDTDSDYSSEESREGKSQLVTREKLWGCF